MPKKARRARRPPKARTVRAAPDAEGTRAAAARGAEDLSLGRSLRASLGLPQVEESDAAGRMEAEEEQEGAAKDEERPPEVRVVSVGSFVPTGHLVCEGCGRIVRWTIPEGPRKELAEVAINSPEGWDVRSLAVSFTGYCPNCRRTSSSRR